MASSAMPASRPGRDASRDRDVELVTGLVLARSACRPGGVRRERGAAAALLQSMTPRSSRTSSRLSGDRVRLGPPVRVRHGRPHARLDPLRAAGVREPDAGRGRRTRSGGVGRRPFSDGCAYTPIDMVPVRRAGRTTPAARGSATRAAATAALAPSPRCARPSRPSLRREGSTHSASVWTPRPCGT